MEVLYIFIFFKTIYLLALFFYFAESEIENEVTRRFQTLWTT